MRKPSTVLALAAALLFTALTGAAVLAQEPTPTPSTPPGTPACGNPTIEGPVTRTFNQARVDLPAGNYSQTIAPPGSPDMAFGLCHVETGASIVISGNTCVEVSRYAPTDAGVTVLNQIISSCTVVPLPTPVPVVFSCRDGDQVAGGQTVTVENSIQVTLPAGDWVVTLLEGDVALFCNQADEYDVGLRLGDCGQATIPSPLIDAAVIRGIVESCTLLHPVTPVPIVQGGIRPPSTGDGGLATES